MRYNADKTGFSSIVLYVSVNQIKEKKSTTKEKGITAKTNKQTKKETGEKNIEGNTSNRRERYESYFLVFFSLLT